MIIVRPGQEQESAPDPPTQALPQAKYPDDAKAADFQMFPMFQLHPVSYYRGRWIHPCVNYIRSRHFPCVFKFRHPVPIPSWEISRALLPSGPHVLLLLILARVSSHT